jgi:hypothetical protein
VSQQTTNRSFDDLARALTEGSISRRRALKLFASTAIAALIPSRALANDDGCVRICHVPRTSTGACDFANARTRCVTRRERRRHLEKHPCDTGGRCQTHTTTTTTSSTTSTSTSITSTSTTTPTTSTTTPMCLPVGGSPCTADTQCCSSICIPVTASHGICSSCCEPGGSCAAGERYCEVGSSCENGSTCCTPSAETCTDDSECCSGLTCQGGSCLL